MPRLRVHPEDFVVEELPLYTPSGEGSQTWFLVEKRLRNTESVARDLARALDVAPRDVGYAGRKDRRAVTRQWFSAAVASDALPSVPESTAFEIPGVRILETVAHEHRLRPGDLRGNRFRLLVREVGEDDAAGAEERLRQLQARGMPNRFGEQRFGRNEDNAERGADLLQRYLRTGKPHRLRRDERFLLSALQSKVFNHVLDERLDSYDLLLKGDVATDHQGALFAVHDPAAFAERLARFEVSPTGPLFGGKMQRPRGEVAALEDAALAACGLPPMRELETAFSGRRGLRLHGGRRPLRVPLANLRNFRGPDRVLTLELDLPAGSYATVLVEELFPDTLVMEVRDDDDH